MFLRTAFFGTSITIIEKRNNVMFPEIQKINTVNRPDTTDTSALENVSDRMSQLHVYLLYKFTTKRSNRARQVSAFTLSNKKVHYTDFLMSIYDEK